MQLPQTGCPVSGQALGSQLWRRRAHFPWSGSPRSWLALIESSQGIVGCKFSAQDQQGPAGPLESIQEMGQGVGSSAWLPRNGPTMQGQQWNRVTKFPWFGSPGSGWPWNRGVQCPLPSFTSDCPVMNRSAHFPLNCIAWSDHSCKNGYRPAMEMRAQLTWHGITECGWKRPSQMSRP